MTLSARVLFFAGTVFALGSLSAGLVHCAQQNAKPASAWQRLAEPPGTAESGLQTRQPAARNESQPAASLRTQSPALPAAQPVPADARCPVCGMYPAKFPRWAAQLHLRDGSIRFFDSPREFFVFLRDLPRYGKGVTANDFVAAHLTDFAKGGWLPVSTAWFVRGSRVTGPMRSDALPAFANREAAVEFITQHGGELHTFAEMESVLSADAAASGQTHHH